MAIRVILIEPDDVKAERLANVVRESEELDLTVTFKSIGAALGQSSIFRPELFLIDVDYHETVSAISDFAKNFPKAEIVCMLNHWNADIAEQCAKAGAIGSMISPLRSDEILEALKLFKMRGSPKPPNIIAFFSPKGRSGKTTIATNLAISLAHESGEAVGLIDADLQFGDMPIFFDAEPTSTIVEAVRDIKLLSPVTLAPYFTKLTEALHMLSSPKRPELAELVDLESLVEIIKMSGNLYRYVLVDLPSGFSPLVMGICEIANTIFLTGMIGSGFEFQHMSRALEMFQGWSDYGKNINVVFSRVVPCNEVEQNRIAKIINFHVADVLPNEYLLISAANSGRMPGGIDMNSNIAKKFHQMAYGLMNQKFR